MTQTMSKNKGILMGSSLIAGIFTVTGLGLFGVHALFEKSHEASVAKRNYEMDRLKNARTKLVGYPVDQPKFYKTGSGEGRTYSTRAGLAFTIRTEEGKQILCRDRPYDHPSKDRSEKILNIASIVDAERLDGDNEPIELLGTLEDNIFYVSQVQANGYTVELPLK